MLSLLLQLSVFALTLLLTQPSFIHAQQLVQQGALINGVSQVRPIDQGDSHYWTFAVAAADPNTGSSSTDLIITCINSDGLTSLYAIDSSNTRYSSTLTNGVNGFLFSNQSSWFTNVGVTAQPLYGTYTIQVFGVAADTYTLSATLIQRLVLNNATTTQMSAPFVLNNGTVSQATNLDVGQYAYASYVVTQAGPVQLALTMTIDNGALTASGIANLNAVSVPTVSYSYVNDITPWALASNTAVSYYQSSNVGSISLYSYTETLDECVAPPCTYSFLVAPNQGLPVQPLITVTQINSTSNPYAAIEDNSVATGSVNTSGIGGNITYTMNNQQINSGQLQFWTFTVLDISVSIQITLNTPALSSNIFCFISNTNPFPDATSTGSTWSLTKSLGVLTTSLTISPSDAAFAGNTVTMEGVYYFAMMGQYGGAYSLSITMLDRTNSTAPFIVVNTPYTGQLAAGTSTTFAFITPRLQDVLHTDLIFQSNLQLFISDLTANPVSGGTLNDISAASSSYSTSLAAFVVLVERDSTQSHAGVYYVNVNNPSAVLQNFTLSVSFTAHTVLQINNTFVSDDPLLTGQFRFFDLIQTPGTVLNLQFLLATYDPNAYGSLYINNFNLATPKSVNNQPYPIPNLVGQRNTVSYSLVGTNGTTGDQYGNYTYTCPITVYQCVWQFTLYCPTTNLLGLMNYTLGLSPVSNNLVVVPIAPNVTLSLPKPAVSPPAAPIDYSFFLSSLSTVTLNVSYTLPITGQNPPNTQLRLTLSRSSAANPTGVAFTSNTAFFNRTLVNTTVTNNGTNTSVITQYGNYYGSISFNPTSSVFLAPTGPTNIGNNFLGTWYVQIACTGQCGNAQAFNYSLLLTVAPFTTNATQRVLTNLPLSLDALASATIPAAASAFYSFTVPGSYTAGDIMFNAQSVGANLQTANTNFWLYSALTPFTDVSNYTFIGANTATTPQSLIFAPETSVLAAYQTVYFSINNPNNNPIVVNVSCFINIRQVLTSTSTTFNTFTPIVAGQAILFDFSLPGTLNPTSFVSNSFIAGATMTAADAALVTVPPFLIYTSYISTTGSNTLPALSSIAGAREQYTARGTGAYTNGDFVEVANDRCNAPTGVCLYHFLVVFPQGAPTGYSLKISALTSASSFSTYAAVAIPQAASSYYTLTRTIAQGEVQLFNLSLPSQALLTSSITISVKPADNFCNPDVAVAVASALPPLFNQNSAPLFTGQTRLQSYNSSAGAVDTVTFASANSVFSSNAVLPNTFVISVTGTTAGSYSLNVTVNTTAQNTSTAIPISLDPSSSSNTVYGAIRGGAGPAGGGAPVAYSIAVPTILAPSSNLVLVMYANNDSTATTGGNGPMGMQVSMVVCMNILPSSLQQANSLIALANGSCSYTSNANRGLAMNFNATSTPILTPGSTLFVLALAGNPYTITASLTTVQPIALNAVTSGTLNPGQVQLFSLTIPAVSVGGQYSTSANFVAAVTASVSSIAPLTFLYLTTSASPRIPLPFASTRVPSSNQPVYDRSSVVSQATQSITVSDLCLTSSCVYYFTVYAVQTVSFSFGVQSISNAYTQIVPGFSTPPTYIGLDVFTYYSFSLPHPTMSATVTLQSLITGPYAGANTNADLLVSWTQEHPDFSTVLTPSLLSSTDNSYGTDAVSFSFLSSTTPSASTQANRTYYVSVFGQRPGMYTLIVQAFDPAPTPLFISANQPLSSVVAQASSDYYQLGIGSVASTTDLSVILSSTQSFTQLYSTFSYTHPGPVLSSTALPFLPSTLPYEMYSKTSSPLSVQGWQNTSGVTSVFIQQITLNALLSSSNALPLQAQSSLYTAVYGGLSTSSVASSTYSLSVSVTQRITLTPVNTSPLKSASFTRVTSGTAQYFEFSWASASLAPGAGAVVALTGQSSASSSLPNIYLTSPLLSAQVDPVMSSPSSYTYALNSTVPLQSNARMFDLQTLCPTASQQTCKWKALVYTTLNVDSYTLAVTPYQSNDQANLTALAVTPVPRAPNSLAYTGYLAVGQFLFYYVDVSTAQLPYIISIYTQNSDGNIDVYADPVVTHPSASTASMQSVSPGGSSDTISITTAGRTYLSLFAQATSSFSIVVTPFIPAVSSSSSSSSSSSGRSSSAAISSSSAAVSSSAASSSSSSVATSSPAISSSSSAISSSSSSSIISSSVIVSSTSSPVLPSSSPAVSSSSSPLVTSSSLPSSTSSPLVTSSSLPSSTSSPLATSSALPSSTSSPIGVPSSSASSSSAAMASSSSSSTGASGGAVVVASSSSSSVDSSTIALAVIVAFLAFVVACLTMWICLLLRRVNKKTSSSDDDSASGHTKGIELQEPSDAETSSDSEHV